MSKNFYRLIFSSVLNAFIFGICLYVMIRFAIYGSAYQEVKDAMYLVFYTQLSNIFLGAMSLIIIPFNILSIKKDKFLVPDWVTLGKYYATITTTITFLVVMCFLGPTRGYREMLSGTAFFFHLISPIMGIVTLLAFDLNCEIKLKHTFYAFVPTFLYFIMYLIMIFGFGIVDFYGFFKYGPGPAVGIVIAIFAVNYGLAFLYRYLINKRKIAYENV